MKYFLLIEQNATVEEPIAPLFLTDKEKETLPFSLLPSLAVSEAEQPETLTDDTSGDESCCVVNEETPEEVLSDDTGEELSETPEEALSDDTGEELSETHEELSEIHEENAATPATVLILSDNEDILAKAKTLGADTLRLPRRQFPLADVICSLPLDHYETVAAVS